jgi:hypothetical protein
MQPISRTIFALAVTLILSTGIAPSSHASSIITAVETGGDVVFTTATGASFDLTALTLADDTSNRLSYIQPDASSVFTGVTGPADLYSAAISGPANFGAGAFMTPTTRVGPIVGIAELSFLTVPRDYISGGLLGESSTTFSGQTFASLGITPGTYVWNLPDDTVTLNVVSAVPVPAAAWLFASALGLMGWLRRKST